MNNNKKVLQVITTNDFKIINVKSLKINENTTNNKSTWTSFTNVVLTLYQLFKFTKILLSITEVII